MDSKKCNWSPKRRRERESRADYLKGESCCSVAQSCLTLCHPRTAARQASPSSTISWSLLKLMPIESGCHPPGFPLGSDSKEFACNAGDPGSIPGSARSPREGNSYSLQYFGVSQVAQTVRDNRQ